MQITINQPEIEDAIRAAIQEQITVKDGMRIDIELKATRGDAGFTAVIDIVPEGSERKVGSEPEVVETPITTTVRAARTPRQPKAVVPETPIVTANQTEEIPPADETTIDQQEDGEPADEGSIAEDAAPTPPVDAPVERPSLFGNLKKPVN